MKKSPAFRFRLRTLFILTTTVGVLLACYIVWDKAMDSMFTAILVGEPGPVENKEDWPKTLQEFVAEASNKQLEVTNLKVHCFSSVTDLHYVWRMQATPGLLEFMQTHYQLTATQPPTWSLFHPDNIYQNPNEGWWALPEHTDIEYFAGPNYLARGYDDRFEVLHDSHFNLLYVHFYYDW